MRMDENYLHDRPNKSYAMISIDNDERERSYDLQRSNVNENDRIH